MENKTITLPSNSLVAGIPKTITIREMTGKIEKYLFSGKSDESVIKGIQMVIVEPELSIEVLKNLTQKDIEYILYQIRSITFGSTVKQPYVCPTCLMSSTMEYDIDDIPVTFLDPDILKPFELPRSKITITPKLPSSESAKAGKKIIRDLHMDSEYEYNLAYALTIGKWNGESFPLEVLLEKIDALPSKDISIIRDFLSKITNYGLATELDVTCDHCGTEGRMKVAISDSFFR